ncbi:helix-turn-helix domain-containing protein [Pedobacter sp.]|uniref:helix-turn-helix domain-containing protein n=1 Tax=Pedobacter sp. TaxID=1411316 RepID=UPI003D7F6EBF
MHNGEIIELAIRRHKISISELSRKLKVSRKSIYNWFKKENLSLDVINKIGDVLDHDFIKDLPEKFDELTSELKKLKRENHVREEYDPNLAQYWKNKYINLLENYTNLLIKNRA